MFFRLIGNHLIQEGALKEAQLESLMEYRLKNRVKLGVLAVEQKMMSAAQADEVNRLQALMDQRFGDIAVRKGYLTEESLEELIQKQGNPYVLFLQGVTEKGYLSKEELLLHMDHFRIKNCLSDDDMEVIKNGTVDEIAGVMMKCENEQADAVFKLALRNVVRFICNDVYFGQIEKASEYDAEHLAYQAVSGSVGLVLGFACENDELLTIANAYAKEHFVTLSADAYDAVCEFINCTNGLYARTYSVDGREIELHPPVFKDKCGLEGELYLFPVKVKNKQIMMIIKVN